MRKIIIDNKSKTVSDRIALRLVDSVIKMGRISNEKKQYTYISVFHYPDCDVVVSALLNKKSDKFVIYDEKRKE